jgi:heat-inducible transcriptional repressor
VLSIARLGGDVLVLDDRKQRILQAVVDDYIQTAAPVGSRTLARKYKLGVSPATIRNEMADLEEMGYLEQPHTSAGRIPSDRGYRFYVDQLMIPLDLSMPDIARIYRVYAERAREMQALIQATTKILSEATQCLALVMGPQVETTMVVHAELVTVSNETALLVVVTDVGLIHTALVEVPRGVRKERINEVSAFLNRLLSGRKLNDIGSRVLGQLGTELDSLGDALERTIEMMLKTLESEIEEKAYLGGTTNILMHPEFQDISKIKAVLSILEEDHLVHQLLQAGNTEEGDISVTIGEENIYSGIKDCSLVSTTYKSRLNVRGRIGVLGPKRMNYAKVVAVVRHVEQVLSGLLSQNVG